MNIDFITFDASGSNPPSIQDGMMWYRSDIGLICYDISGSVHTFVKGDDSGSILSTIIAIKKDDEVLVQVTTLQPDDDLFFNVKAGEFWVFNGMLIVSEDNNNPNISLGLVATNGLTGSIEYSVSIPEGSSTESTVISDFISTVEVSLSTTKEAILLTGTVEATTSGTVHLYWAQQSSDLDGTIMYKYSKLVAHRQ